MKNLTTSIALLVLVIMTMSSFTKPTSPFKNLASTTIVDHYIQASSKGMTKDIKYLFAEDFKHIKTSTNQTSQFNKSQTISLIKKQEGYVLNCETSYKIIEQNKDYSVAKVTMAFPKFVRTDYITMTNQDSTWIITQVVTTYSN